MSTHPLILEFEAKLGDVIQEQKRKERRGMALVLCAFVLWAIAICLAKHHDSTAVLLGQSSWMLETAIGLGVVGLLCVIWAGYAYDIRPGFYEEWEIADKVQTPFIRKARQELAKHHGAAYITEGHTLGLTTVEAFAHGAVTPERLSVGLDAVDAYAKALQALKAEESAT